MEQSILEVEDLSVSFKEKKVLEHISFCVERGRIYSVIGKNGCGKTTLLRTICRSQRPDAGQIRLEGRDIRRLSSRAVARTMAILSQNNDSMSDVTVETLTGYGRYAHKKLFVSGGESDREIVDWAMERTGVQDLRRRKINTLSGGERQRAWMAMLLAQKPAVMLLDEPTTYLDIAHQLEIMELVSDLNRTEGITILMVLHDINHAARYSDELIVLDGRRVFRQGAPWTLIEEGIMEQVFGVESDVLKSSEGDPIFYAKRVI